ncbi:MAG: valyl-tRNA synthetase [Actinomycetota bacterium]|nr:valyl-tRNA synthetase [Actinomycetota bacterium]
MAKGKGKGPDLREMEIRWAEYWEKAGVYRYDPTRGRDETFVVDTPPPTVSGSLHIGHMFSFTHTDLMVRYRRMKGDNIFYPMGWDDNGLPTERRVQNVFNVRCDPTLPYDDDLKLEWGREGDVLSVSRTNFIELCDEVVQEDEKKFQEVFQTLGLSVDWNETYATINRRSRYVSQLSFLNLVKKGHAELRDAPTMWDVDFQSAVAQAEVEDRERDGAFYKIRFDVEGGGDFHIATTRPELLPACIAVTAHPDDKRYANLIGKNAITPLFEAPVPIIADEAADPEKGTGILMICTFGDAQDVEWWRELGVPAREVIARNGSILAAPWGESPWLSNDPERAKTFHDKLVGLSINQARRAVAEMLEEAGVLDGEPEKTRRPVKFYEKGERPLEFVVSRQWFIPVMDKKEQLIEQGRKIAWHPDMFRKRYEDWVEGLNLDWCVSRQRYFGVPIPVWYAVDDDGHVDYDKKFFPAPEELPIDPSEQAPPGYTEDQRGAPGGFVGDPDIFDTWATSALTPLIPSGWPHDLDRHKALYPNNLRPNAHDIIRTWDFVTITRSYLEDGSIPWSDVAISGWILDPDRKKMGKSKGNAMVPTAMLEEFGADAVRYWSASAKLGVDTTFDNNVLREGKRLVTKLLNASRLIRGYEGAGASPTHPLDRALIARLRKVVEEADRRWSAWDHAAALAVTESWFWSDFTDNYLELSKARAYEGDASAIGTLRLALDVVLRLLAPVLIYATEEVWNQGAEPQGSIHTSPWPSPDELEGEDEGGFDAAVLVLTQIRKAKSDASVSIKFPVRNIQVRGPAAQLKILEPVLSDVLTTGSVETYELVPDEGAESLQVSVTLGDAPASPDR